MNVPFKVDSEAVLPSAILKEDIAVVDVRLYPILNKEGLRYRVPPQCVRLCVELDRL